MVAKTCPTGHSFGGSKAMLRDFVYSDSKTPEEKFGVPCGNYVAEFLGTEDREEMDLTKFGKKGSQPRMAWMFEVVEPLHMRGRKFEQQTGTSPGSKTKFTHVLAGLIGHVPAKGENVRLSALVGQLFRVDVTVNPESDKGNFHIAYMTPLSQAAPSAPGAPPSAPSSAGVPEPHYWVWDAKANQAERVSGTQIREMVKTGKLAAVASCMSDDKSGGWKKLADFGLDKTDSGGPLNPPAPPAAPTPTPPGPPPF
jgi:hypothetical protein